MDMECPAKKIRSEAPIALIDKVISVGKRSMVREEAIPTQVDLCFKIEMRLGYF